MSSGFGYLDELKALEHSTLKVPYETLNKQYRNVQKAIDRDCSSLSQTICTSEKVAKSSEPNKNEILNSLSSVVEKLRSLKKRSNDLRNQLSGVDETVREAFNRFFQSGRGYFAALDHFG